MSVPVKLTERRSDTDKVLTEKIADAVMGVILEQRNVILMSVVL